MRKAAFGCLLVASVYIMVGCGNNSAVLKEANVEQSVETSKDTDVNNEAASNDEEELESTDTSSESDAEDSYAIGEMVETTDATSLKNMMNCMLMHFRIWLILMMK